MKNFIPKRIRNTIASAFIERYEIKGDKLFIVRTDKQKIFMPYTKENEELVLKVMEKQANFIERFDLEKMYKKNVKDYTFWLAYDVVLALYNLYISFYSRIPALQYTVSSLFILLSVFYTVRLSNDKECYDEVRKINLFMENRDRINEDIKKHYNEMFGEVKDDLNTITINDLDNYSYKEILEMSELVNPQPKLK